MTVETKEEVKQDKAPWEQAYERDHVQPEESETEPEDKSQPEEDAAEPEKAEQEHAEESPETEEEQEEAPAEEEKSEEPASEEAKEEEPKEAGDQEDDKVREYAINNGMTFHDAKAEFTKAKAIAEKYQHDPLEMAKALRSQQAEYDKLRTKTEQEREEQNKFAYSVNPKLEVDHWVAENKPKIIDGYRKNNPARSADMSDDAILEVVGEQALASFSRWNDGQLQNIKVAASEKRDVLLKSLSDKDRRFLPDIKVVLDKTSDSMLLAKGFDFQHVVYWAKGMYYDRDIKLAEEKATKRATEQPKIVGAINGPKGAPKKPSSGNVASALSGWEKNRAREMYPSTMTDEECYKAYSELKNRKKK